MDGITTGTGIGQPVRRREDLRLITGGGRYSDDLNLPGQAYAVMVRSPYAHALIRSLETETAAAMPGVLAILTSKDLRQDGLNPMPHIANSHPADWQSGSRLHRDRIGPSSCVYMATPAFPPSTRTCVCRRDLERTWIKPGSVVFGDLHTASCPHA
jgi:CO/xanthine dehydrogenase Mo-binding subunit